MRLLSLRHPGTTMLKEQYWGLRKQALHKQDGKGGETEEWLPCAVLFWALWAFGLAAILAPGALPLLVQLWRGWAAEHQEGWGYCQLTCTPFIGEPGRCVVVEVEAEGRDCLIGKTPECCPRELDSLPASAAECLWGIMDITSTRHSQVSTASVCSCFPVPILKS